jgi:hypothetical protein
MESVHSIRDNFPINIESALDTIVTLKTDVADAHDALLATRITQAHTTNTHRNEDPAFQISNFVYLSTAHRRRKYLNGNNKRVAKFMPWFDGPYTVVSANPESSTYTLDLPDHTNIYPTFHVSELKHHVPNNAELYPSRELQRPSPIVTQSGSEEWEIDTILDQRKRGRGYQYLVQWRGYGPEADVWVSRNELEDMPALKEYTNSHTRPDEDIMNNQSLRSDEERCMINPSQEPQATQEDA